jgi:uncharacterized membrane protein YdjX (TVP38/TMEM64 family)
MNPEVRSQLIGLGALILLFSGAYFARQQLGIEWSAHSVRDAVADFGLWGPLFFVTLIAFRAVLMVPSQILLIAAGLCFGTVFGTLYGALGITLSGVIAFQLVRWTGRDALLRRSPPQVQAALDGAGRTIGATFVALATGYPVGPITAWHAAAGLTGMALVTFVLAVAAGSLVRAATYTFFGSRIVEAGPGQLLLAGGVVVAATTLPLCFARSRRWVGRMLNPAAAVARAPGGAPRQPAR